MSNFTHRIERVIGPVNAATLAAVEELMRINTPSFESLPPRKFAALAFESHHVLTDTEGA